MHYQLHKAKGEKQDLYSLKDNALHLAVNEKTSENQLGEIEEEISSERKRSVPPAKAVMILKRFLREHKEKGEKL